MTDSARQQRDWVSSRLSRFLAWGVPTAALVIAIFLPPPARTLIWSLSLLWMGVACIANATRCGRTHCYFTGPFFLIMAVAVALHGTSILWLGANGWIWLGTTIVVGGYGVLWLLPERIWGKFARFSRSTK